MLQFLDKEFEDKCNLWSFVTKCDPICANVIFTRDCFRNWKVLFSIPPGGNQLNSSKHATDKSWAAVYVVQGQSPKGVGEQKCNSRIYDLNTPTSFRLGCLGDDRPKKKESKDISRCMKKIDLWPFKHGENINYKIANLHWIIVVSGLPLKSSCILYVLF